MFAAKRFFVLRSRRVPDDVDDELSYEGSESSVTKEFDSEEDEDETGLSETMALELAIALTSSPSRFGVLSRV